MFFCCISMNKIEVPTYKTDWPLLHLTIPTTETSRRHGKDGKNSFDMICALLYCFIIAMYLILTWFVYYVIILGPIKCKILVGGHVMVQGVLRLEFYIFYPWFISFAVIQDSRNLNFRLSNTKTKYKSIGHDDVAEISRIKNLSYFFLWLQIKYKKLRPAFFHAT